MTANMEAESVDPALLLAEQREIIDVIDKELVRLINERARAVLAVAAIKHANGLPIFHEGREDEVIERAINTSEGPCSKMQMAKVFVGLMQESRHLQQKYIEGRLPLERE